MKFIVCIILLFVTSFEFLLCSNNIKIINFEEKKQVLVDPVCDLHILSTSKSTPSHLITHDQSC